MKRPKRQVPRLTIPQSPLVPAPFTQGSLWREIRESPLRIVKESALFKSSTTTCHRQISSHSDFILKRFHPPPVDFIQTMHSPPVTSCQPPLFFTQGSLLFCGRFVNLSYENPLGAFLISYARAYLFWLFLSKLLKG